MIITTFGVQTAFTQLLTLISFTNPFSLRRVLYGQFQRTSDQYNNRKTERCYYTELSLYRQVL